MTHSDLPPEAERILQRVLTGELRLQDAEVEAACARHPALGHELQLLSALQRSLQDLGADGPEVAAAAAAAATPADRQLVQRVLRRAGRRRQLWPALVVAAALAMAALWLMWPSAPAGPPGMLGPELARIERQGSEMRVTFQGVLPPGGTFRLRLQDQPDSMRTPLETSVEGGAWTFPQEWLVFIASARAPRLTVTLLDDQQQSVQVQSFDSRALRP